MAESRQTAVKGSAARMLALPALDDAVPTSQTYTANALPVRIMHDGPLEFSRRYWDPQPTAASDAPDSAAAAAAAAATAEKIESKTAYLRGRKLLGKEIAIPSTHQCVLLRVTEQTQKDTTLRQQAMRDLEVRRAEMDAETYDEEFEALRAAAGRGELEEQVGVVDRVGQVDSLMVWGHETVPTDHDGGLARLDEWHNLASAMHHY